MAALPSSVPWRAALQQKMKTYLQHHPNVRLVISPDWDGICAAVLFAQYAKRQGCERVHIAGTYDCKKIMTTKDIGSVESALFLDLDLPMEGVCHIGQHLLGVPLSHSESFNPNVHFQNTETWTKYPFSTAHLIYYGLLSHEDRAIHERAEVALQHCDSSYSNAAKYKPNCTRWVNCMFAEEEWMANLLNGTYASTRFESHKHLVDSIAPYVRTKKRKRDMATASKWDVCKGHQTCTNIDSLPALLKLAAQAFDVDVPDVGVIDTCVFAGCRKMIPLSQVDPNLEQYLHDCDAKSHAIVSTRMLSLTVPMMKSLTVS